VIPHIIEETMTEHAVRGECITMALRGRKRKAEAVKTVATIEPTNESEETEVNDTDNDFDWDTEVNEDTATPEPEGVADEANTAEGDAQPAEEAPKEPEVRLDEEFPNGTVVKLIKTDWKNNYAAVQGVEDKRNVQYLSIKLTHYANGKERPAEKQSVVAVRPQSVEVSEVPVPEPEPAAETSAE
jgi:hypothetical protein